MYNFIFLELLLLIQGPSTWKKKVKQNNVKRRKETGVLFHYISEKPKILSELSTSKGMPSIEAKSEKHHLKYVHRNLRNTSGGNLRYSGVD